MVIGAAIIAVFAFTGPKNRFAGSIAAIDASAALAHTEDESSMMRRLLDERRRDRLESKLQQAGWYNVTPTMLMLRSIIYGIGGAGGGLLLIIALHKPAPIFWVLTIVLTAFAASVPYSQLNQAAAHRKLEIARALPDFLDILTTTVEAGIALNGALATTADGMAGALGQELHAALQDIRLGRSRADALIAMAQRVRETDLTTVVTAIVQSERLGASISELLRQMGAEARERRMLRAEELAAALSNKLVFPMALCMLPALMIMIFGGVLARFYVH
jgi:tight adherence protein C